MLGGMDRFRINRALLGLVAGLCLVGGLALAGLVSPVAKDYLSEKPLPGGSIIQTTSPMVQVRFVPHLAHARLLRGPDPAVQYPREPGQA